MHSERFHVVVLSRFRQQAISPVPNSFLRVFYIGTHTIHLGKKFKPVGRQIDIRLCIDSPVRYKRWCCSLIPAESDSLPHAHTQATKTYYKHQDSRINKAQELNTKTSTNSDIQDLPKSYQDYQDNDCQGRLLASFQDDAKCLTKAGTMTQPASEDDLHGSDNTTHSAKLNAKFKIGDKFLQILRDNTFNGVDKGDVIDHMEKVLEISEWIKILDVDHNRIRLHIFPILLSLHAREWWNNEIKGTATTWNELGEKFFLKYYLLSYTCNSKIPDDLDNGTDYLEFLNWLGSKFKNHWNMDRNTKNRLWDFYVKECNDKGSISDAELSKDECDEPYNKNQKNSCSGSFFKPYLDAQEGK
ncbi:hypothetical protein Tco_1096160 [Tanacetum coccineum]